MTRKPLIAGNWKMNGTQASARQLAQRVAANSEGLVGEVLLCPPAPYLSAVLSSVSESTIQVGAQNICDQDDGAFTGEISVSMLIDLGCSYVLIGHSERRAIYRESNELIGEKFAQLHRAFQDHPGAPCPILCIGETQAQRHAGETQATLEQQLAPALVMRDAFPRAVIAYEPVWAIGTGIAATAEMAQVTHANLRAYLRETLGEAANEIRILYGGSVKAANAEELFSREDIDGGLIGGASLDAGEFLSICQAVPQ